METTTLQDFKRWCASLGMPLDQELWQRRGVYPSYSVPTVSDASSASGLANVLISAMRLPRVKHYLAVQHVTLPSDKPYLRLVERFRQSFGLLRAFSEAPVHIFSDEETEDLESLLALSIISEWDIYFVNGNASTVFATHHDHGNLILFREPSGHDRFLPFIAALGAERL